MFSFMETSPILNIRFANPSSESAFQKNRTRKKSRPITAVSLLSAWRVPAQNLIVVPVQRQTHAQYSRDKGIRSHATEDVR